jgi:electron transfer flavoprotein beta subunit
MTIRTRPARSSPCCWGWPQATFASKVTTGDVTPRLKILKASEPPKRSAAITVPDVATLVAKLKNEDK